MSEKMETMNTNKRMWKIINTQLSKYLKIDNMFMRKKMKQEDICKKNELKYKEVKMTLTKNVNNEN